jgi:hypothetical protein
VLLEARYNYYSSLPVSVGVASNESLSCVDPRLGIGSYVGIFAIHKYRQVRACAIARPQPSVQLHSPQPRYPIILGAAILPLVAGLLGYAIRDDHRGTADGLLIVTGFGIGTTLGPLALQAQYSHPARLASVLVTLNLFVRVHL